MPKSLEEYAVEEIRKLRVNGNTYHEIAQIVGCAYNTVSNYCKKFKTRTGRNAPKNISSENYFKKIEQSKKATIQAIKQENNLKTGDYIRLKLPVSVLRNKALNYRPVTEGKVIYKDSLKFTLQDGIGNKESYLYTECKIII
jgi:transposase